MQMPQKFIKQAQVQNGPMPVFSDDYEGDSGYQIHRKYADQVAHDYNILSKNDRQKIPQEVRQYLQIY